MKKQILLTASLVLLASCTLKDNLETQDETGIRISVADFGDPEGVFAQDNAKSIVYYEDKKFKFAWENGDEIGVFPIGVAQSQQLMMTVTKEGGLSTTYSGSTVGWILNHEVQYASYYPMQEDYDLHPDNIMLDYTGQTQNDNDTGATNLDHLGAFDYLYTEKLSPTADGTARFSFQHAGAIVRFRVPAGISGTFTAVNVTAQSGNKVFPTKMKLDLIQGTLAPVETSSTFTVNLAEFTSAGGNDYYLNVWCMMPPVDLSTETLTVTFVKGTAARDIKFEIAGKNLSAGSAYSFNGTDKNLPDFIDLGLPSGTLWASWNVGATSPEEPGNYYAWGELETKPYFIEADKVDGKHPDHEYQYRWVQFSGDRSSVLAYYSKYNLEDGKSTLDDEDDVATQTYGDKYRMPTRTEWEELLNSDYTSVTENNNGLLITSKIKEGSSIFISQNGYASNNDKSGGSWKIMYNQTDRAEYWTRNGYEGNSKNAYRAEVYFSLGSLKVNTTAKPRSDGYSVRAVKPRNN